MKASIVTMAAVLACILAASAAASSWPKDPRVCSYTPGVAGPRAQCAGDAAKRAVRAHSGDGSIVCRQGATLLRWTCQHSNGTTYRVAFTVSRRRWYVSVRP